MGTSCECPQQILYLAVSHLSRYYSYRCVCSGHKIWNLNLSNLSIYWLFVIFLLIYLDTVWIDSVQGRGGKGILPRFSRAERWLPLGLSIHKSPTTVLFRTSLGQVTTLNEPEHVYISTPGTKQYYMFCWVQPFYWHSDKNDKYNCA